MALDDTKTDIEFLCHRGLECSNSLPWRCISWFSHHILIFWALHFFSLLFSPIRSQSSGSANRSNRGRETNSSCGNWFFDPARPTHALGSYYHQSSSPVLSYPYHVPYTSDWREQWGGDGSKQGTESRLLSIWAWLSPGQAYKIWTYIYQELGAFE